MLRILSALKEWLELRARLREECEFHLDRAAADFRGLGFAPALARQKARTRFGGRRNLRLALRELGGDWRGLAHLLRAHRVMASAWFTPVVLFNVIAAIMFLCPAPRDVVEGLIGRPLKSETALENSSAVFLSSQGSSLRYAGITPPEFDALRAMSSVTGMERYGELYARARATPGVTLETIQSEARAKTGNRRFWAAPLSDRRDILMQPAKALWLFVAIYAVFSLRRYVPRIGRGTWLLYGAAVFGLNALTTTMAWGLAVQIYDVRLRSGAGPAGVFLLVLAFFRMTAMQYRYWRQDLLERCPVCLDRLMLPLTEGTAESVLLRPAVTESVCAHGHGVLVESRWSRAFRPEESPLRGLVGI